jgi:hypothetical protein
MSLQYLTDLWDESESHPFPSACILSLEYHPRTTSPKHETDPSESVTTRPTPLGVHKGCQKICTQTSNTTHGRSRFSANIQPPDPRRWESRSMYTATL